MRIALSLIVLVIILWSCSGRTGSKTRQNASAEVVMSEVVIPVGGMFCAMCEASIEKGVAAIAGVDSVKAVLSDSTAFVRFNPNLVSEDDIKKAIISRGYKIKGDE